MFRKLRNLFVSAKHDKTQRPVDHIAFLGLWDTVAAYGLPVDEMTRGVSRYLWPLELPDRQLNPLVRKACHALSLDDERTTFHPLLWDESPETVATGTRGTDSERITQVWFAGVHSNVGGGYPDNSLAHVSLTWILSEAKRRGLTLKEAPGADPDAFKRVCSTQDKDGRIYDLRNGLGGYYRYGPRSVAALSDTRYSDDKRDCVKIAMPKIHESVFARIAVDAHLYAPVGLPPAYEILTYDEKIVSPDKVGYETSKAARGREKTQEHVVGSSIWRRRIIYFLTVIASVYLLAYPLTSQLAAAAEYTTRLRPLSDVIRMVGMALPGAVTSRWINAYARDPLSFVLHAGLVALLLWLSAGLRSRITDQMRCAWRVSLSKFDIHGRHAEPPAGTSALQKLICLGLFLIALYPVPGWFGYPVPAAPEALQIFIDSITKPYFRFFAIAILITMLLKDSTIAWFRLKDGYKQAIATIKLKIAPGIFAVLFLYGGVALASHYIFNIRDSFGDFCKPDPKASKLDLCTSAEVGLCTQAADGTLPDTCTKLCAVKTEFDTRNVCTSTKVKVFAAQTYAFEISKKDEWSFLGAPSGPGGMPLSEFWHHKEPGWWGSAVALAQMAALGAAYPIKRTFDRPFGRVITRYGDTGNTENFIDTRDDPRTVEYLRETFKPANDGELYVYLNKPVSGFWSGLFRDVNAGTARVRVVRVPNK